MSEVEKKEGEKTPSSKLKPNPETTWKTVLTPSVVVYKVLSLFRKKA